MRVVCLDIGTRRIGVATSDPMGLIAQPLRVIERHGDIRDLREIAHICRELDARLLLIGIPLDEDGEVGKEATKVKKFAERIEQHLRDSGIAVPVRMWDERYSTAIAGERLIEADLSRARRKAVIDKMAAVVILEDYLEHHPSPSPLP